jgi:hypothetical protein
LRKSLLLRIRELTWAYALDYIIIRCEWKIEYSIIVVYTS